VLVLLTMVTLFAYGALFVIDRDDKLLLWGRIKGWLPARRPA